MNKKQRYFKYRIFILIGAVLLLAACNNSENTTIRVRDNSNFNSLTAIKPLENNIISKGYLSNIFGCNYVRVSQFAQIEFGRYAFVIRRLNEEKIEYETRVYLYDASGNEVRKTVMEGISLDRIVYDEKRQKILIFRNTEKQSRLHGRQDIYKPDIVITLDMNLEKQWRLYVPDYIKDIVLIGEYYYIIRQKEEILADNVRFYSQTYVDKVDSDGKVVATFYKDNFEIREVKVYNDTFIISGVEVVGNRYRTLLIYGDKETFFTDNYTILPDQNRAEFGVIANEVLMITGRRGVQYRDSRYFINLVDLNTMELLKTLDISETASRYEISARGIFFGDNNEQIGIIGTAKIGSRLEEARKSLVFASISSEFQVDSVYLIDIGEIDFLWIQGVKTNGRYIYIVCSALDWTDHDDDAVVELRVQI